MPKTAYDAIVIGEGVAGLAAANALAEGGLRVATLEAQLFGGLVLNVNELDPAPGGRAVSGAEFASELMQANAERGVTSIQEPATALRREGGLIKVDTGSAIRAARQIVIASGARLKRLGIPGESEFEGRGVSQCADCDGPMYQNEEVVVVGGGDSALQEALVLARFRAKVRIVHRGQQFHASSRFIDQVAASERISTVFSATLKAIAGGKMVESVEIRHADGRSENLPCAGVFAYIGLEPNAEYLPAEIERDAAGFVITRDTLETALGGVWAVGAVRSGCGGSLDDAIAEAQRAARAITARLT